jgi:hypothetical protein
MNHPFANTYVAQLYIKNEMSDPRYAHCIVEVPEREKTHKYKRFAHEKRAKRTPGMKRVETPHIMVTKWDVENANKRNKKIGRARDRADKYGDWSENLTDTMWEDNVNKATNDATNQRVQAMVRKECPRKVQATQRDGRYAWASYEEYLEYNPMAKKRHDAFLALLNSPEQIAINEANDAHNATQGPIEGDFVMINLHSHEDWTDDEGWTDDEDWTDDEEDWI